MFAAYHSQGRQSLRALSDLPTFGHTHHIGTEEERQSKNSFPQPLASISALKTPVQLFGEGRGCVYLSKERLGSLPSPSWEGKECDLSLASTRSTSKIL